MGYIVVRIIFRRTSQRIFMVSVKYANIHVDSSQQENSKCIFYKFAQILHKSTKQHKLTLKFKFHTIHFIFHNEERKYLVNINLGV